MNAPKEIADKVIAYEKASKEADKLFKEVADWLNKNGADGVYIEGIFISNKAFGQKQVEGEYCDQSSVGESGDSFQGTYFHQIDGSKKYVAYKYWC